MVIDYLGLGDVARVYEIVVLKKLFLYAIQFIIVDADRGQDRAPVLFFNTDDYVAAVSVGKAIGKRANSTDDILRIPSFFILDTILLNDTAFK